jgi:hypothetical protein
MAPFYAILAKLHFSHIWRKKGGSKIGAAAAAAATASSREGGQVVGGEWKRVGWGDVTGVGGGDVMGGVGKPAPHTSQIGRAVPVIVTLPAPVAEMLVDENPGLR